MRVAGVAAMALVATTVWGCGGGDGDDVEAAPAAGETAKAEVERAYVAYWDMVGRLESEMPSQDAEIADRATGAALVQLTSQMAMLEMSSQLNRHDDRYEHEVLSVEIAGDGGAEAVVHDCFVDDTVLIDRETLDPVPGVDQGITTQLLEATLVSRDSWQVQEIEVVETFDGARPRSCSVPGT